MGLQESNQTNNKNILNLDQWFRSWCCLKKTIDACRMNNDHNSSPWVFGSGELQTVDTD